MKSDLPESGDINIVNPTAPLSKRDILETKNETGVMNVPALIILLIITLFCMSLPLSLPLSPHSGLIDSQFLPLVSSSLQAAVPTSSSTSYSRCLGKKLASMIIPAV
jgi:hypothetical protein